MFLAEVNFSISAITAQVVFLPAFTLGAAYASGYTQRVLAQFLSLSC